MADDTEVVNVAFPFLDTAEECQDPKHLCNHPSIGLLHDKLSLDKLCGYISLIKKPTMFDAQLKRGETRESPTEDSDMLSCANDAEADRSSVISFRATLSSTVTKDPRKVKTDKVRLANDETFEDFVLFDCVFGVPLFDEELNGRICERLASEGLLAQDKQVFLKDSII